MISQMEESKEDHPKHSDFSIDHILNRAGSCSSENERIDETRTNLNYNLNPYSWLQCTRYCPPKVPRTNKREGPQKRQVGTHPRIPFTSYQLSLLEEKFQQTPYLSTEEVITLSKRLDIAEMRVKIWFQNRRARERRERSSSTADLNDTKSINKIKEDTTFPENLKIETEDETRTSPRNIVVSPLTINSSCENPTIAQENMLPMRCLSNPLFYSVIPFNPFLQNHSNAYVANSNTLLTSAIPTEKQCDDYNR